MARDVTQGQTQPIHYILKREGGAAIDLTGVSKIRAVIFQKDGIGGVYSYDSTDAFPKVSITDAANGEVALTPSELTAHDNEYSDYYVQFRIYYTASQWEPAPPDNSEVIRVWRDYSA